MNRCRNRTEVVSMRRQLALLLFVVLAGSCCRLRTVSADFIVDLEEDEKECFHIRVSAKGSILSGNFDCWEESEEHMRPCPRFSAWIDEDPPSPAKRVNPTVWKVGEDYDFTIDVRASQRYRLCFLATSKKMRHQQQSARKVVEDEEENEEQDAFFQGDYKITVGFNLRVHDLLRTLAAEEIGPDALRAITLQKSALHVTDQWDNMHDHFSYMHFREAEHMKMSAQINDRVMGWTILESLLVVTMAIGQVMYWKSFFEQRRFL